MYRNMWFCVLYLLYFYAQSEAATRNKHCYKAKTCVHNNHETCGVNGRGGLRRFLDSCDIFEFNCLKGTDYKKAARFDLCKHLPSLYDRLSGTNGVNNQIQDPALVADGNYNGNYGENDAYLRISEKIPPVEIARKIHEVEQTSNQKKVNINKKGAITQMKNQKVIDQDKVKVKGQNKDDAEKKKEKSMK